MTFPNQLTVLRIILTPVALALLMMNGVISTQLATGVFIIASLTDLYDGHFARKYGYVTKKGKFLDPVADKILISTMLIGFAVLKYIKFGLVMIIVLRDIFITALRGYMIYYGEPVTTNLLAKWKTFTQVGLVYTVFVYINIEYLSNSGSPQVPEVFMPKFKLIIDNSLLFVTAFTVFTGLIYLYENKRPIRDLAIRMYYKVYPFHTAASNDGSPLNDGKAKTLQASVHNDDTSNPESEAAREPGKNNSSLSPQDHYKNKNTTTP